MPENPGATVAVAVGGTPISVIDAFTSTRFAGNPAAVCVLASWPDDDWLQRIAAEMNLAESAFLVARVEPAEFDLRWFTPTVEVDLCGHATLASAHALAIDGPVRFHTRSGVLTCVRRGDRIELDFPASFGRPAPLDPRVVEALGVRVRSTQHGTFLLAEVADAATVRELVPDIAALAEVHPHGVIVTAAGDAGYDFVSRVFAPNVGIAEDHVTGSAHCQLAPFWSARLGRDELAGFQASRRGGEVGVRLAGDRVVLSGSAVTVLTGVLAP
ncbi:MAG: PhzF family phenazine biosynthesis protein [Ilumatobacteraceae bacterium]|jgi:predicted PhzF superfamily epimerase YddE/YHI9|nr:PhzF family phenazine biosynthesis protein [Ilumatobacteraceae bacterium]